MKALTLWQPWASLCVLPRPCDCGAPIVWRYGLWVHQESFGYTNMCRIPGSLFKAIPFKTIETRSWPAPPALIGQRIAIHAAKRRVDQVGCDVLNEAGWPIAIPQVPLGAVVGTAVLTDCVPIDDCGGYYESVVKVRRDNGTLWRCYVDRHPADADDVSDQLPFGDFAPGRWAWLLADAEPCDPIPVTGRQGVWNWES